MCDDVDLRSEAQKIKAVLAGEIGDGQELALLPQEAVGKARDITHVDTCTDNAAALAYCLQGLRHEIAHCREDDRGIEQRRWHRVGITCPGDTQAAGKRLSRQVPGSRKREYRTLLPDCHLRQNVGSGAEAVEAELSAVACDRERTPADKTGAQKRGTG